MKMNRPFIYIYGILFLVTEELEFYYCSLFFNAVNLGNK